MALLKSEKEYKGYYIEVYLDDPSNQFIQELGALVRAPSEPYGCKQSSIRIAKVETNNPDKLQDALGEICGQYGEMPICTITQPYKSDGAFGPDAMCAKIRSPDLEHIRSQILEKTQKFAHTDIHSYNTPLSIEMGLMQGLGCTPYQLKFVIEDHNRPLRIKNMAISGFDGTVLRSFDFETRQDLRWPQKQSQPNIPEPKVTKKKPRKMFFKWVARIGPILLIAIGALGLFL